MDEEWRLTAELDGGPEEIEALVAQISDRLPSGARLTRDVRKIRVYSTQEAEAARIEAVALALLERTGLGYELWHDRWDDEAADWEEIAPDLPPGEEPPVLDEPGAAVRGGPSEPDEVATEREPEPGGARAGPFPGAVTSLGDARMLVVLTFLDRDSGTDLRARLVAEGIPLVSRRRGFGVPAADEGAAAELAAHLRDQAPSGASVETAQLPARRRG